MSLIHELPTSIRSFGAERIRAIDTASDALVFGSEFVHKKITAEFGCKNARQVTIPTGYPPTLRTQAYVTGCRERLRHEVGVSADAIVVLGCGPIDHREDADLFVQVARLVAADGRAGALYHSLGK